MTVKLYTPPTLPARGYSQVCEITSGKLVMFAGQVPHDVNDRMVGEGSFEAQVEQVGHGGRRPADESADLAIAKSLAKDFVTVGDSATFTLTVTHRGGARAYALLVKALKETRKVAVAKVASPPYEAVIAWRPPASVALEITHEAEVASCATSAQVPTPAVPSKRLTVPVGAAPVVASTRTVKPTVAPYSGHMFATVARVASGSVDRPAPKNSTNLPTTFLPRSSSVTRSTRSVPVAPSRSLPVRRTPITDRKSVV